MRRMKLVLVVLVVSLVGCSVIKERSSPIVQKAQSCGAGELSGTSMMAVQDWFGKPPGCAVMVEEFCKPVRINATGVWMDSMEGRVVTAARNVAQWVRKPNRDHE